MTERGPEYDAARDAVTLAMALPQEEAVAALNRWKRSALRDQHTQTLTDAVKAVEGLPFFPPGSNPPLGTAGYLRRYRHRVLAVLSELLGTPGVGTVRVGQAYSDNDPRTPEGWRGFTVVDIVGDKAVVVGRTGRRRKIALRRLVQGGRRGYTLVLDVS